MAIDDVLLNISGPVLRLYQWDRKAITIGRFQSSGEINLAIAEKEGVTIVRRQTGGKGVLHGNDITLSLCLPVTLVPNSLKSAVHIAGKGIVQAFQLLGLKANQVTKGESYQASANCFSSHSPYEVIIGTCKMAGIALRMYREKVLYQISIPLSVSGDLLKKIFIPPRKKTYIRSYENKQLNEHFNIELKTSAQDKIHVPEHEQGLRDLLSPSFSLNLLKQSLIRGISSALNFTVTSVRLTKRQEDEAVSLARKKYAQAEWTFSR